MGDAPNTCLRMNKLAHFCTVCNSWKWAHCEPHDRTGPVMVISEVKIKQAAGDMGSVCIPFPCH